MSGAAQASFGYDPADGRELWKLPYPPGYSNSASPVVDEAGFLYIDTGFDQPQLWKLNLTELERTGGLAEKIWSVERNMPRKPTPLQLDGLVYTVDDLGIACCIDADDGTVLWRRRIPGEFSTSPISDGQSVYFFSQEGPTTVIRHGREFLPIAENQLDSGTMATPAVHGNDLIVRTRRSLYRIAGE